MSVEETLEAQYQARISLVNCAMYRRERDNLIRHAHRMGITITEIARILGMNRGHISDIANAEPGGPQRLAKVNRGTAQHPKDDAP